MKNTNQVDNGRLGKGEERLRSPGRRALLRGAATAMPAILTLQSGAALARSSNLISAAGYDAKDRRGGTLCLDVSSVRRASRRHKQYDLGHPPYARVFRLRDRDLHIKPEWRSRRISEKEVCKSGQPAYYPARYSYRGIEWKEVHVPRGIVVSATALRSFAGRISLTHL